MSDTRDALLAREAEGWRALTEVLAAIPPDRREEPGLPEGWSVKDALWHIACWAEELPASLPAIESGTFIDAYQNDAAGEARNAEILTESRTMALPDVEAAFVAARDRARAALTAMAEASDDALRRFDDETIDHYGDHIDDLRAFATSRPG
jgi:hypothetical protein